MLSVGDLGLYPTATSSSGSALSKTSCQVSAGGIAAAVELGPRHARGVLADPALEGVPRLMPWCPVLVDLGRERAEHRDRLATPRRATVGSRPGVGLQ